MDYRINTKHLFTHCFLIVHEHIQYGTFDEVKVMSMHKHSSLIHCQYLLSSHKAFIRFVICFFTVEH